MAASPVLAALEHVWRTLTPLSRPMALMGGLAVAAWGHVRATRDVDILMGVDPSGLPELLQRLTAAGLRPKHQPPVTQLGSLRLLQLRYEPPESYVDIQIDLLLADSAYHATALSRRTPLELPGVTVPLFTLACEDLILHKLLAGRVLDRADVGALLRQNYNSLDRAYLAHWAKELSLNDNLIELWGQAFPGGRVPP